METIKVKTNNWVFGVHGASSYEANGGEIIDLPEPLAALFLECGMVERHRESIMQKRMDRMSKRLEEARNKTQEGIPVR